MVTHSNERVLLYHFQGTEEAEKLKPVFLRMGIRVKAVEPHEYGFAIGTLAGIKELAGVVLEGSDEKGEEADFSELMMVMCGFTGTRMDELLSEMRRNNVPGIRLKAMLTPTNMHWNTWELYHELKREHQAMSNRKTSEMSQ